MLGTLLATSALSVLVFASAPPALLLLWMFELELTLTKNLLRLEMTMVLSSMLLIRQISRLLWPFQLSVFLLFAKSSQRFVTKPTSSKEKLKIFWSKSSNFEVDLSIVVSWSFGLLLFVLTITCFLQFQLRPCWRLLHPRYKQFRVKRSERGRERAMSSR